MSLRPLSASATTKAADPLQNLRTQVAGDMERVNHLIMNLVESHVPLIPELSNYTTASGGKRLRPMLTLATAQLCGYEGSHHIALAASVEFMHTATLLHDDVVDGSDLRRGLSTANHVWGNKASILVGDYLLGKAFHLMVSANSIRILDILSHAAMVIAEGEVLQLSYEGKIPEDDTVYMQIINAKTAELFAAACEISAVLTDQPEENQKALRNYGLHLGRAFQMVDDALDYCANQSELGKSIGEDFREGKATLPAIIAYQAGNDDEKAFWQRTSDSNQQQEADLTKAVELITTHKGVERTLELAHKEAEHACHAISVFPASPIHNTLEDIANFAVDRHF